MSKFFFFMLMSLSAIASAKEAPFANIQEIRNSLGLQRLVDGISSSRTVKIAILDKGFYGVEKQIGKTLPDNTLYLKGPLETPADLKSEHGLKMAQIVSALATDDLAHPERIELFLYNTYGFTNFKSAIDDLIERKIEIVLSSEVWEYGSNIDGQGFINTEVNRAIDSGAIWINAAGNFARTTYNSSIDILEDNWVRLPDNNNSVKLVCKPPKGRSTCPAKIVLSWNDFKNDSDEGTDKDLDLALTDDLLNVLRSSSLRQSSDRSENRQGYSKYPREIISSDLKPGTYLIRVKNYSGNFSSADRLRITADGEFLEMPQADAAESLLTPADNARVIAVGANDSDRSGRSVKLNKPDLMAPSRVVLNDIAKNEFLGSSNSAAFAAASAVLLKLAQPDLNRESFLKRTRNLDWTQGLISINMLGFFPADGRDCFPQGTWPEAPSYIRSILNAGGILALTNAGWRIMTPFDPILLAPQLSRRHVSDMVTVAPEGFRVYQRGGFVPSNAIEIFPRPYEVGLCGQATANSGRLLAF